MLRLRTFELRAAYDVLSAKVDRAKSELVGLARHAKEQGAVFQSRAWGSVGPSTISACPNSLASTRAIPRTTTAGDAHIDCVMNAVGTNRWGESSSCVRLAKRYRGR